MLSAYSQALRAMVYYHNSSFADLFGSLKTNFASQYVVIESFSLLFFSNLWVSKDPNNSYDSMTLVLSSTSTHSFFSVSSYASTTPACSIPQPFSTLLSAFMPIVAAILGCSV